MIEPREITEQYNIQKVLKSSRSGIVFRALDPSSGLIVTIKLITPNLTVPQEVCRARFVKAMEALKECQPSTFPKLLDFGFTPDACAFMVMSHVDGTSMDDLGGLPAFRLIPLLLCAVDGLQQLAARDVWHGNLTTGNVLAVAGPEGEVACLFGFGTDAYQDLRSSGSALALGDEASEFAAPERYDPSLGVTEPDWRADVYSLAMIACRVLRADVGPADAPAPKIELPRSALANLLDAKALRAALEQCLRRSPTERPQSYDALARALRVALVGREPEPEQPDINLAATTPELAVPPKLTEPEPEMQLPPRFEAEPLSSPTHAVQAGSDGALLPTLAEPMPKTPEPAPTGELELPPSPPAVSTPAPAVPLAAQPLERTVPIPTAMATAGWAAPSPEPFEPVLGPPPPPPPDPTQAFAPATATAPPKKTFPEAWAPHPRAEMPSPLQRPLSTPEPKPPIVTQATTKVPGPPTTQKLAIGESAPQPPRPTMPATPAAPPPEAVLAEPDLGPAVVPATAPARKGETTRPHKIVAKPPKRSRWLLWVGVSFAALVVVAAGAGYLLWQQSEEAATRARRSIVPTPRIIQPTPTPLSAVPAIVAEQLAKAEAALTARDYKLAEKELDAITPDLERLLTPADAQRFQQLANGITMVRRDVMGGELKKAVTSGNIRAMRDTLAALSRDDVSAISSDPDTAEAVEEARRVVSVHTQMLKAQKEGNQAEALQLASTLLSIVPRSTQATELRDRAAAAIEAEADGHVRAGRFDAALSRLETIRKIWPERSGLGARISRVRGEQEAVQRLENSLAAALQSEKDQRPEKGLELLQSVSVPASQQGRVAELRGRLDAQLRQLDALPPKVDVKKGSKLEYDKNKSALVPLVVSDDHGVKTVRGFARPEGAPNFVSVTVTKGAGNEYVVEVSPTIHGNKAVDFYIVVTDHSGHTGQLGSQEKPIHIKKKWRLFG
jgi:serine/threonine protein kinase